MRISTVSLSKPLRYLDALKLQQAQGVELEIRLEQKAVLLLLQHTPVFTLGRKTDQHHLPWPEQDLAARTGAEVVRVDRGGSVTYHGPGQLTAYLLLNLRVWNIAIHQHLDLLEAAAIDTLAQFDVQGHREPGMTGVWVKAPGATQEPEKICAIGVSARRWVTYHGLSLNVDLDLTPFSSIIPCGLAGKRVTSMAKVLGRAVKISEVEAAMVKAFGRAYGAETKLD